MSGRPAGGGARGPARPDRRPAARRPRDSLEARHSRKRSGVDSYQSVIDRIAQSGGVVMLVGGLDSGKTTLGRSVAALGHATPGTPWRSSTPTSARRPSGPRRAPGCGCCAARPTSTPARTPSPTRSTSWGRPHRRASSCRWWWARGCCWPRARAGGRPGGGRHERARFGRLRPDPQVPQGRAAPARRRDRAAAGRGAGPDPGDHPPVLRHRRHHAARPAEVGSTSVEERASRREEAMRRYFGVPLQRWRVKPTVFMPALPALFDQAQLDRLLVGTSDGEGCYYGDRLPRALARGGRSSADLARRGRPQGPQAGLGPGGPRLPDPAGGPAEPVRNRLDCGPGSPAAGHRRPAPEPPGISERNEACLRSSRSAARRCARRSTRSS